MRCMNRHSNIHKYDACRSCCYNISGYGICGKGYENFYYRRNKNNGCGLCRPDSRFVRKNYEKEEAHV